MKDPFGRTIDYLRVSVTDRCNLRCVYCMPEEGIELLSHNDILTFDETADVVAVAVELGVCKVRLTGGEPLVRRGIAALVGMLSEIKGIEDLAMTTNGTLLAEHAEDLVKAGLRRINVSLDSVDQDTYGKITRGGDVQDVLDGISAAKAAGMGPIKINCVVEKSSDEPDARMVAQFGRDNGFEVRYIRRMRLEDGSFSIVEGGTGGDCSCCNRLRLSADGVVRPCLFSDVGYSVRELGARKALERAVREKPKAGKPSRQKSFRSIGG